MWLYIVGAFLLYGAISYLSQLFTISDFKDKVVVITGCDTGFGNIVSKRLDKMGFKVVAICLTQDGANKLKSETSNKLVAIVADITKEESVVEMAEQIKKETPHGIWCLINNAGVFHVGMIDTISMDVWKKNFEVNVFGMVSVTKKLIPSLKKGQGRIINIASVVGRYSMATLSSYSGSKFAVESLSDALRQELGPWGVKVIIIEPGIMNTPLYATTQNFDRIWNNIPTDVQELYGREYLEHANKTLQDLVKKAGGDPNQVADGMVHATIAKFPKHRYTIGGDKFFWILFGFLPTWLSDFLIFLALRGGPKPKGLSQKA